MQYRFLGKDHLKVSAIGYGCPPFQGKLKQEEERQAIAVLHRAIEIGINFIDTADHNNGNNEEILATALKGKRSAVVLATKFGNLRGQPWAAGREVEGRPEYVFWACDNSLRRLQTDYIDLYYLHRVDPKIPIEETVGAMAKLVEQGKVRHLGLSEAGPETIRRAHAVHPIAAVQSEYSLWSRDIEDEVIPTLRELGISLVAYSPLGRGFLTGAITSIDDLAPDDYRRSSPRFEGENFQKNLDLVAVIERIAGAKGVTPAQLGLAWALAQGDDVVPIPGTKQRSRLEENVGAVDVELTEDDLAEIAEALPQAAGDRYPSNMMATLN